MAKNSCLNVSRLARAQCQTGLKICRFFFNNRGLPWQWCRNVMKITQIWAIVVIENPPMLIWRIFSKRNNHFASMRAKTFLCRPQHSNSKKLVSKSKKFSFVALYFELFFQKNSWKCVRTQWTLAVDWIGFSWIHWAESRRAQPALAAYGAQASTLLRAVTGEMTRRPPLTQYLMSVGPLLLSSL